MTNRTDNDALIEVAQRTALPASLLRGDLVSESPDRVTLDLERYADQPRRKRGDVRLDDTPSLIAYVNKHKAGDETELFASWEHGRIVAVLNGHAVGEPGWGDHRATLALQITPEWARWTRRNGHPMPQAAFAEHIEESLRDIVEPDGATMLELAQSFQASTSVAFRSARRLHSGETQLRYEEQTDATAGAQGDITIPQSFSLALTPWEGCPVYRVVARLRYRINNGDLTLSYHLDRPEEVQRTAFADIVGTVTEQTDYLPLAGNPPAAIGP